MKLKLDNIINEAYNKPQMTGEFYIGSGTKSNQFDQTLKLKHEEDEVTSSSMMPS